MQQFYSVLVQQIARVDASDDTQRHAVYDRARFDLVRLTGDVPAAVGEAQTAALEQAIARLESEIGHIQRGRHARGGREALLDEVRRANPDLADARLSNMPPPQGMRQTAGVQAAAGPAPVRDLLPGDPFADPDPMGLKAARARINQLRREIGGPGAVPVEQPDAAGQGTGSPQAEPGQNSPSPENPEHDLRFEGGRWERPNEQGFGQSAFPDGGARAAGPAPGYPDDPAASGLQGTGVQGASVQGARVQGAGFSSAPGFVQDAETSREQPASPEPAHDQQRSARPSPHSGPRRKPDAQTPSGRKQNRPAKAQTSPSNADANLPATQTRMPPRLGRDPQHLLRARSIGSPTVFALLGASGAVALIGLIALVVALDPATGGVGADPGQRPIVLFSPTRPTQFSVPRGNSYVRIPGDDGGVHLSSQIAELSTGPNSAAIAVRIAPVATDVLQGQRAEVRIEARQITNRPSPSFAVAYRTGAGSEGAGPSSDWNQFVPTAEFAEFSFRYTVPPATRDDVVHDILIWADTTAQGGSIEVRSITINLLR